MAYKVGNKTKKTKRLQLKLSKKLLLFIALFAGLGSVLLYVRAEGSDKIITDSRPQENLLISYVDEKPQVATKSSNGQIIYSSRPRSIEVSAQGKLVCTPEDGGAITSRQLEQAELEALLKQVNEAKKQTLPEQAQNTKNKLNNAFVNQYKGLYVKTNEFKKKTTVFDNKLESSYFKSTQAFLETLCKNTTNIIDPENQPRWDVLDPASPQTAQNTLISNLLVPKVDAGGTSPPPPPPPPPPTFLDTNAENRQHAKLSDYRMGRLAVYTRASCLDTAARAWAKKMAEERFMRHSNPINDLPQFFCGNGWTSVGENVGFIGTQTNPLQIRDDLEYSYQISDIVFQAFTQSPAHNANLLSTSFTHVGIGAYKTSDKTQLYIAQIFWRGGPIK